MQTVRKKVRFTYQDYLLLPYDKRYELIEGDLHRVPAPLTNHQKVSRNLQRILWEFVQKNGLGEVLYAPVDVVLSSEDVVQPDILFIAKERLAILTEKNVRAAPDLVIEILSPSSKEWDLEIKRKLYEKYGVREYWIVDPEAQTVEVLQLTDDGYLAFRVFSRGTKLKSPLLKDFSFPIEAIFG